MKAAIENCLSFLNLTLGKFTKTLVTVLQKINTFPFWTKILPMWLKILNIDAGAALKNIDKVPLPVDKNVAETTYNLLFKDEIKGAVDARIMNYVRNVWNKIAGSLKVPVIYFDTPLWILGGKNGCSSSNYFGCANCPVNGFCRLNS